MSNTNTPFRLLLSISAALLAVAGLLGWLMPASLTGSLPPWTSVVGIAVVVVAAFLVALSGRKVVAFASELAGDDQAGPARGRGESGAAAVAFRGAAGDAVVESGAESRAVFVRRVRGEVSRTSRYGHDLSLLALSVDPPSAAEEVTPGPVLGKNLGTIGVIVRNSTRVSDAFGHVAENRLVILLAETEVKGAQRVAEKLRRNVEVYPFGHSNPVTVSIGVAEYRSGDEADTLISRVEGACAAAMAAGGNRVETA